MRPNYLNFLKLVLRSIESEVEFNVYRSFLLSSIIIAIEFDNCSSNIYVSEQYPKLRDQCL